MKNSKWIKGALLFVLSAFGAASAAATESGFYLGLNYGQSKFGIDDGVSTYQHIAALDDSDTVWLPALGYRFTPYFGIEASYVDMGAASMSVNGVVQPRLGVNSSDYGSSLDVTLHGPVLALVLAIPAGRFEFNPRLGVLFAETDVDRRYTRTTVQFGVESQLDQKSTSTTEILLGFGVGYTFGNHLHVRVDWSMVEIAGGEQEANEYEVSLLTAGLQYRL